MDKNSLHSGGGESNLFSVNRELLDRNKELLGQKQAAEREVKDGHEREAELSNALARATSSPEVEAGLRILRQTDDILEYYKMGNRKALAFDWLAARLLRDTNIDLWGVAGRYEIDTYAGATLLEAVEKAMGEKNRDN